MDKRRLVSKLLPLPEKTDIWDKIIEIYMI